MATPQRKTWVVLAASVFAQASISALQFGLPALGPAIHLSAGFDTATIGLLFGLAGTAGAISVVVWGRITDHTSDRFVSVIGLLLTAGALVLAAAAALEGQFVWMGALIVISGISAAAPSIGIVKGMSGSFIDHPHLGLALGMRQAAIPIGAGLAGLALPVIALQVGLGAALIALAATLLVAAAVMSFAFRHPGRHHRPAHSAVVAEVATAKPPIRWRLIFPICGAAMLLSTAQIGITALLPIYLFTARNWSYTGAAAAFAGVMFASAVERVLLGIAADRLPRARVLLMCSIGAITGVLLFIVSLTGDYQFSAGLLIVAAITGMGWASLSVTITVAAVPTERIGQVQGVYNAMCWIGGGISPIIIGALVQQFGWSIGWLLLAFSASAGVIVASTRLRTVMVAPTSYIQQNGH